MRSVRKISKRYYLRQIVACFLTLYMSLGIPVQVAMATPEGGDVVAGEAGIAQNGNTTTIDVITSQVIINWDSFDTLPAETVEFLKANGGFMALNRILKQGVTNFNGSLIGNQGNIFLVFPNGSLVAGPTAFFQGKTITMAAGLDISNQNFMSGILDFASTGIMGEISNYGEIIGDERVALMAQKVLNAGAIRCPGGFVLMAAGDEVYLAQEGSDVIVKVGSVTMTDTSPIDGIGDVINEGIIDAAGGEVVLAAGDTFSRAIDGLDEMTVAAGGGTGRVGQFGTINVDGIDGDAGNITLTAADVVVLGTESVTTANGGTNGDGGDVIVYSPDTAIFAPGAVVEAKGGSESGDGGFFELSGKEYVDIFGSVDMTAAAGKTGSFLIDPYNIWLNNENVAWNLDDITCTGSVWDVTGERWSSAYGWCSYLDIDLLALYLSGTNVTITTDSGGSRTGWIVLDAGKDLVYNGSTNLKLVANDYITIKSGINFTGSGNIELYANTDMFINAPLRTGGNIILWADRNGDTHGNMHAGYDAFTKVISDVPIWAGGSVDIKGNEIRLGGAVTAFNGDLTITGRDCLPPGPGPTVWYDVWAYDKLYAKGDIKISATGEELVPGWCGMPGHFEYHPGTIHLFDDVTACGDLVLFNNTETGPDVTLRAGHDIHLENDGIHNSSLKNCETLTGLNSLTLIAGHEIDPVNKNTVISVSGSSLTMEQDVSLDTADYMFGNQNSTHLTLISNEGSVTSDMAKWQNAADEWASIGATAKNNIDLAGDGSIKLGNSGTDPALSLWAKFGDIDVEAGYNVTAPKNLKAGDDITVKAKHGIAMQAAVSGGDMELKADTDKKWGHDVVAYGFLNAGGTMDVEGTNVKLFQGASSGGDMTLYAHGLYSTDPPGPAGPSLIGSGDVCVGPLTTTDGKIEITATAKSGGVTTGPDFLHGDPTYYGATGTIHLLGNVTANGGFDDDVLLNSNTVASDGVIIKSTGDDVVLASGKTMRGQGDLTVRAKNDIKLGGFDDNTSGSPGDTSAYGNLVLDAGESIYAFGNLSSDTGNIDTYSSDYTTYLYGNVWTLDGHITFHNNVEARGSGDQRFDAGGWGSDLTAKGDIIKTTNGDLTLDAGRDPFCGDQATIFLGGDVKTHDGDLTFEDDVIANGKFCNSDQLFDAGGCGSDLIAKDDISKVTNGSLTLDAADHTIKLYGDVTTVGGNLNFEANVEAKGSGDQTFAAGGYGSKLDADGHINKTSFGSLTLDAGYGPGSDIYLGGNVTTNSGNLVFEDKVIADGKYCNSNQRFDAGGFGSDLIAKDDISKVTNGSLTLDAADHTIKLYGDVTTVGGNLNFEANVEAKGYGSNSDQRFDAGGWGSDLTAKGDIKKTTCGDLTLDAGRDPYCGDQATIFLGGDVTTENGNLTFEDDVIANGKYCNSDQRFDAGGFGSDLIARDDIEKTTKGDLTLDASNHTIYLAGDVSTTDGDLNFDAKVIANGWGDQLFDADGKGKDLTAKGDIIKVTCGDLTLDGGYDGYGCGDTKAKIYLYGDVKVKYGSLTFEDPVIGEGCGDQLFEARDEIHAWDYIEKIDEKFSGSLYMHAGGDISLAGDVTTAICCPEKCWSVGGGISIISDNGKIYTPGFGGALAVDITGRSDQFGWWGPIGVKLPYGPGRAAIVIKSAESLVLHKYSDLLACGTYYAQGVDDRMGVGFLAEPATIGDYDRYEGEPFDAAIYVGSTTGDVHLGGEVDIRSREWVPYEQPGFGDGIGFDGFGCGRGEWVCTNRGAMIADAYDTVTFGDKFEESLADGRVGDRLEVCSRITEWKQDAVGRLPYVYGGGPFLTGYNYVLRGAGLENSAITDSRAWVLEDEPGPSPAPLYTEAGEPLEKPEFEEGGCPALMNWFASEAGIPADQISVLLGGADYLATNIQPCEACARLKAQADAMGGLGADQVNAWATTVRAALVGPPTPEMIAGIRTALADNPAALSFDDAATEYVRILNEELGIPVEDALAMLTGNYAPDSADLGAYVGARSGI